MTLSKEIKLNQTIIYNVYLSFYIYIYININRVHTHAHAHIHI